MNRKRNFIISLIAAVLSCLLVYAVYELQLKQVQLQKTVNVVVPKDFIEAGSMITASMMQYKSILSGSFQPQMFRHMDEVIGQETMVPLGKKEPILRWKVTQFHLTPLRNEATFQIPKPYILSISNGIRAGDQVRVYVSGTEINKKLFEKDITVASVKSASNVEIEDSKNATLFARAEGNTQKMYASRRDANGVIDKINLNLTEQEWLMIDRICSHSKNKLVIALAPVKMKHP